MAELQALEFTLDGAKDEGFQRQVKIKHSAGGREELYAVIRPASFVIGPFPLSPCVSLIQAMQGRSSVQALCKRSC